MSACVICEKRLRSEARFPLAVIKDHRSREMNLKNLEWINL